MYSTFILVWSWFKLTHGLTLAKLWVSHDVQCRNNVGLDLIAFFVLVIL